MVDDRICAISFLVRQKVNHSQFKVVFSARYYTGANFAGSLLFYDQPKISTIIHFLHNEMELDVPVNHPNS